MAQRENANESFQANCACEPETEPEPGRGEPEARIYELLVRPGRMRIDVGFYGFGF